MTTKKTYIVFSGVALVLIQFIAALSSIFAVVSDGSLVKSL